MADKIYSSLIDSFLDDREPDWEALDLQKAKKEGEHQLDRTHKYVDEDFLDAIEGESHHTQIPAAKNAAERLAQSRAQYQERQKQKDVNTSIRASQEDWRHSASHAATDFVNDIADDNSVMAEKLFNIGKGNDKAQLEHRKITDSAAKKYINDLLNTGMEPSRVAAKIDKLAENRIFNKSMAQDYLNQQAGFLGLAYIEPNQYMEKCPDSYERMNKMTSGSKVRAASVRQISACEGCHFFKKDGNSKTCNLYHLPVIGSKKELRQVINHITAGVPEGHKKAALVKIANRDTERVSMSPTSTSFSRVTEKTASSTIEVVRERHVASTPEFNAKDVADLHTKGATLQAIYKFGVKKAGSAKTTQAVKEFIANLKKTGAKVALSQIDCTFLKDKLGMRNPIVGAAKCGSCTYRSGMHCGLTGGTLLSFPGMDKAASNHKIAADAPKDGVSMLQDFDLMPGTAASLDINTDGPEQLDISLDGSMQVNLDE